MDSVSVIVLGIIDRQTDNDRKVRWNLEDNGQVSSDKAGSTVTSCPASVRYRRMSTHSARALLLC